MKYIFLARDWFKTGEYLNDIPQFSNLRVLRKKYLKDNKHNSLHLPRKYVRIFVFRRYLFLKLSLKKDNLGTDIVHVQICEHILASNRGYCLYLCSRNGQVFTSLDL